MIVGAPGAAAGCSLHEKRKATDMTHRALFITAAAGAALLASAAPAAAQSFLLPATPEKGVWIEATYTDHRTFDQKLPTSVWYLSGRMPFTARLSGVVDVPFSYAKADMMEVTEASSSVLGNPYLGLEYRAAPRITIEFGARAPLTTADEESFADVTAIIADPERLEAFMKDVVPVTTAAVLNLPFANGLSLRARAGVTALFYTGDEEDVDTETGIDYGAVGTWEPGIARVALGFSGRWFASADEGGFSENSRHHIALNTDVLVRGVRPGVSLRLPVEKEFRDLVGPSVGLYLQVPLR
jgi:hypothetical protein